jgi:hypothetical protein
VSFDVTNQILIRFSALTDTGEKVRVHLFTDFKKAYDSAKMEVLYNILIEFGVHMNLVKQTTKLHGLSPRANYTDRATAACR